MKSNDAKLQTYTKDDFENADRLTRLRMYLVEAGKYELTDRDWKHLERVKQAFYLSVDEVSRGAVVSKIRAMEPEISVSFANQLYDEAQELFGSFTRVNRLLTKGKIVEKLSILADKAASKIEVEIETDQGKETVVDTKMIELTRKLLMDIATLEGYDKPEPPFDHNLLIIPPLLIDSHPETFYNSRNHNAGEH